MPAACKHAWKLINQLTKTPLHYRWQMLPRGRSCHLSLVTPKLRCDCRTRTHLKCIYGVDLYSGRQAAAEHCHLSGIGCNNCNLCRGNLRSKAVYNWNLQQSE